MSSTLSTQNRQTFLRRKYCFFPVAIALSPPVGRCEAAIGRPPLCSAMRISFTFPLLSRLHYQPVPKVPVHPAPVRQGSVPALPVAEPGKPSREWKELVAACGPHVSRGPFS